jgi:hypothetical protein
MKHPTRDNTNKRITLDKITDTDEREHDTWQDVKKGFEGPVFRSGPHASA